MKPFFLFLVAAMQFIYFDGNSSIATNVDLETVLIQRNRHTAPFLWIRDDSGKTWIIRDAATLQEVHRAYDPVRALEPEHRAIRERLRPLEQRERELDRLEDQIDDRMDDLSDQEGELTAAQEAELQRLEKRLREVETQMRELEKQMRVVEADERKLEKRQDALEEEADRKVADVVKKAIARGVAVRE